MLCRNPVSVGSHYFPCGRCDPCRINRRRVWTNRIMLETQCHGSNSFWTLTYQDENLPRSANGLSTLAPEDAQRFMKRIRKAVAPVKLRFFLVGEYGDETWRPHYHVALFGMEHCRNGATLRSRGRPMADRCCACCRLVHRTWGFGDIDGGRVEEGSAQYLAGYVLKKLMRYDDARLEGRMPEFSRMSLRPGIGRDALHEIADGFLRFDLEKSEVDVPAAIRRGQRLWPLGQYLRRQLRQLVGRDVRCPDEVLVQEFARLLPLRLAARSDASNPSFKAHLVQAYAQQCLNRETRSRLYKKRGAL